MSTYHLDRVFNPASIAVIGASRREGALGRTVLKNLIGAGFKGKIGLINPKYRDIDGLPCINSIAALDHVPDLAVIATPPATVPGLVGEVAARGVPAAIIITAGLGQGPGSLADTARLTARRSGLRLIGPNCLGVMNPAAGLNASFAARLPPAGDLALVSQSGAVAAGLIEWAASRAVGFSSVVSLGDKIDVDFGDCLDYFASDRATRAILLYVEAVTEPRKFMSAARAAARVKPVVVLKSGRHALGAKAAATHTGALAGSDAVYDAAFRRAGLLRVFDLDELFDAAEILGRRTRYIGPRLAILTNGGGVGVLSVDRLVDLGGQLAQLSLETLDALDKKLPATWSRANPVDIIGDADANRFGDTLDVLLADAGIDGVLVLSVPTALAAPADAAREIVQRVAAHRRTSYRPKPVLAAWIGADQTISSIFAAAGIPNYATEADAVRGFMHLVHHAQAQDALMETPQEGTLDGSIDREAARTLVKAVLAEKRAWLDPLETARLMALYGVPYVATELAKDPDEAVGAARPMLAEGGAVALKILSPDIVHKSDVGGVQLDLTSIDAVRNAAQDILARAKAARPDARLTGLIVQKMVRRPKARELILGLADDPTFGPVVVFGRGGTAVEVINDKALALPPLDTVLARDLISRTRVSRILGAYRDVPAADIPALERTLVALSRIAEDIPEIRELDINPLLADASGVLAVDARVMVAPVPAAGEAEGRNWQGGAWHPRLVIRPYPHRWVLPAKAKDGRAYTIRPVRPEDEPLFEAFFQQVTAEDLRLRFFAPIREFDHVFIARLTQLDYARAIAFVAIDDVSGDMLGAVRLHADANHRTGEYAILIRSDLKGSGIGWTLMKTMIRWAKAEGLTAIEGQVLSENTTMLAMCSRLGFDIAADPAEPDVRTVRLDVVAKA